MNGLHNTSTDTMFAPLTTPTPKDGSVEDVSTSAKTVIQSTSTQGVDADAFNAILAQINQQTPLAPQTGTLSAENIELTLPLNLNTSLSEEASLDINPAIGKSIAADIGPNIKNREVLNISENEALEFTQQDLLIPQSVDVSQITPLVSAPTHTQPLPITPDIIGETAIQIEQPIIAAQELGAAEELPELKALTNIALGETTAPIKAHNAPAITGNSTNTKNVLPTTNLAVPVIEAQSLASANTNTPQDKTQIATPTRAELTATKAETTAQVNEVPQSQVQNTPTPIEIAQKLIPQTTALAANVLSVTQNPMSTTPVATAVKTIPQTVRADNVENALVIKPTLQTPQPIKLNNIENAPILTVSHEGIGASVEMRALETMTTPVSPAPTSAAINSQTPIFTPQVSITPLASQAPNMSHIAVQQVSDAIVKNANKSGDIVIRLDPTELGKVNISFSFDKNNGITANVVAETSSTTAILRERADVLATQLKQGGFENINLNFDTQDDNQSGAEAHMQFAQERERQNQSNAKIFNIIAQEEHDQAPVQTTAPVRRYGASDAIDIKL